MADKLECHSIRAGATFCTHSYAYACSLRNQQKWSCSVISVFCFVCFLAFVLSLVLFSLLSSSTPALHHLRQLLPCTLGLLPLTCASTLFSTCTPSPPQLSLYLSPLFCSVYVKSSLVFAVPALVLIKMSSIDLPARFLLPLDSASDLSSTKMFYLTTLKEVRHKECGLFCLFLRNLLNWRGSIQMVLKQSKPQLLICFFS